MAFRRSRRRVRSRSRRPKRVARRRGYPRFTRM